VSSPNIPGALDLAAYAALSQQHRPTDPEELAAEARLLAFDRAVTRIKETSALKSAAMATTTAQYFRHALTHRKDCSCYKSEERDPKCEKEWPAILERPSRGGLSI
jgi:hypothetical protein